MSSWTHITACMSVETSILAHKTELRKQIKHLLKDAPKITGSEGDADVFINIQSGHDWYISQDCEHCKYKDSLRDITVDGEDYTECDGPDDYDCSATYQTRAIISIQGDLRDRRKPQTKKEFEAFKNYINKIFYIRDYAVNIEGD